MDILRALDIPLKVLFVLVSIALIGIILLQMSRHAGLGGAFGAGSTYTVFGREEEADPKRTATTWLAFAFMVLAFLLSYFASR
ncbi:MAG: preprotein translocase subunit SecG [Candidatus Bipolaricaulota bacterium]|nr:preprotein translocase subunit SecG [Candidatus Bipolaricaulota bacterium]MDW8031329.1 preprotein translocase subunit SecG [Candidatus Bipolaricaulota bacterium]